MRLEDKKLPFAGGGGGGGGRVGGGRRELTLRNQRT